MRLLSTVSMLCGLAFLASVTVAEDFALEQSEDKIVITQGDHPVATYHFFSGAKPVIWPVYGPGGAEMTRGYPLKDAAESERSDHIHHRSLWFTHGGVNGVDFWAETEGHGTIKHQKVVEATGGKAALIVTDNDWLKPDGTRVLTDRRRFTFAGSDDQRWIDCDITLTATDGQAIFTDTKEGSFGIRIPGTMKVDAKLGGKILNAEGQTDKGAWGKPASWVDYTGPVAGENLGIAILNHPSSFNYPTRWHVRTYGLFAANPFGTKHFVGGKAKPLILAKDASINLRYRVVLHRGSTAEAKIQDRFDEYAKSKIEGP